MIHVKCRVRDLLSGIITMTALYSINLHIAGMSNVPLFGMTTLFKNGFVDGVFGGGLAPYKTLIIVLAVAMIGKLLMDLFLKTKAGYLLRAVGDNDAVVTSLARDKGTVKIMGLAIANGLIALSGSVMCQQQRFFEIQMGTGAIVIGLASVIIGINLFRRLTFIKATTAVVLGSILYKGLRGGGHLFRHVGQRYETRDRRAVSSDSYRGELDGSKGGTGLISLPAD